MIAHCAPRIFTGYNWLQDYAVLADESGIIADLMPQNEIPSGVAIEKYATDSWLVPAFLDLQIYGAGGRLLAEYPEPESLTRLVQYCRSGGAAWCMPTVATNSYDVFYNSIDAVRAYWQAGGQGVLGLHVEGPWIHPLRKGAHVEKFIHIPTAQQVKQLLDYGRGVIRFITLAPELISEELLQLISSYDVIISAGHSNATYEKARRSFGRGITAVTHLYNAMTPLQHRAPGLVGAAMEDERVMVSIIPDGYHVDYAALRIAKKVIGDRLFVITDAVTDTTSGYYQHYLAGDKYEANGILSGSALTTIKALQNLVQHAGIEPAEAIRMCSLYPAKLLNDSTVTGSLQKGSRASMALINEQLQLLQLIN